MKHRIFWTRFFLVASILTAVMIFCFSAQMGEHSQRLSDGISLQVARIIKPGFHRMTKAAQQSYIKQLGIILRKNAHFLEFALLGFNLMAWLSLRRPDKRRRACQLTAWIAGTLYAGTDELHQLFISARTSSPLDVAIDSAGCLVGVLVATLGLALIARRAQKQH